MNARGRAQVYMDTLYLENVTSENLQAMADPVKKFEKVGIVVNNRGKSSALPPQGTR